MISPAAVYLSRTSLESTFFCFKSRSVSLGDICNAMVFLSSVGKCGGCSEAVFPYTSTTITLWEEQRVLQNFSPKLLQWIRSNSFFRFILILNGFPNAEGLLGYWLLATGYWLLVTGQHPQCTQCRPLQRCIQPTRPHRRSRQPATGRPR